MKPAKLLVQLMPRLSQGRRYRPTAPCSQGADQQGHNLLPRRGPKQWLKVRENSYNGAGKGHC
jgi:hypothetical protein